MYKKQPVSTLNEKLGFTNDELERLSPEYVKNKWLCMIKKRYPEHYETCKAEVMAFEASRDTYMANVFERFSIMREKFNEKIGAIR